MDKKQTISILTVMLVLLLAVAGVLYNKLGADLSPDNLISGNNGSSQENTDESISETTDSESEPPLIDAPDFTAYDADGSEVKLSDYFGKPIVLNCWASWCAPCKMEMPEFEEKYKELGDEVQFLMVNMTTSPNETLDDAKAVIADNGYTFPVLYDIDGEAMSAYTVYSFPTTYFINAEGKGVAQAMGMIGENVLQQGIDMITE